MPYTKQSFSLEGTVVRGSLFTQKLSRIFLITDNKNNKRSNQSFCLAQMIIGNALLKGSAYEVQLNLLQRTTTYQVLLRARYGSLCFLFSCLILTTDIMPSILQTKKLRSQELTCSRSHRQYPTDPERRIPFAPFQSLFALKNNSVFPVGQRLLNRILKQNEIHAYLPSGIHLGRHWGRGGWGGQGSDYSCQAGFFHLLLQTFWAR